jgi:hypothetical protein
LEWNRPDIGASVLCVGLVAHEIEGLSPHEYMSLSCCSYLSNFEYREERRTWVDGNMASEIRSLSFSSGQLHPLAEQPIIDITIKGLHLGYCNVLIEIVGGFLAFESDFDNCRMSWRVKLWEEWISRRELGRQKQEG